MERASPRPDRNAPLVVIVDSDESFGTLLQHFLEKQGYCAFRLPEARYALRLMRELRADLLITSLDGDEIDGMELLVGLSAEPERPPVLLCSRHPSASPAMAAATGLLGVRLVLPRPCRFDVIASAVERLVGSAVVAPQAEEVGLVSAKIAVVAGTRPEVIKLVPVVQALRGMPGIEPLFISTGQHRQMLDQALAVFGEKPDLDLQVMSSTQTLHEVTTRTLTGMREVLERERPDWVVVQGDTVTAFAAALAAFYSRIPVAHVEAGLRSGDRHSPFPEEVNRRMVDQLSEALFAPTAEAAALLRAEGFAPSTIHVTGNTVVDALLSVRARLRQQPVTVPGLPEAMLAGRRMLLVTAHRRESFGDAFREMCLALRRIVDDTPDVCVVYPVHLNPNVDGPARALLAGHDRIALLQPAGYAEFVTLLERAHIVLTDSGGVQEEAPTFAKPLLVLREVTERPEGIAAGVARLVGTTGARIHAETMRLLRDDAAYRRMASGHNPYGDGQASQRIARFLAESAGARNPLPRAA